MESAGSVILPTTSRQGHGMRGWCAIQFFSRSSRTNGLVDVGATLNVSCARQKLLVPVLCSVLQQVGTLRLQTLDSPREGRMLKGFLSNVL
eukprot:3523436-Rhodomonas_salina.1